MRTYNRGVSLAVVVAMSIVGVSVSLGTDGASALPPSGTITAVSTNSVFLGRGITAEVSGDGRFISFADLNLGGVRVGEPTVPGAVQVALNGQGQVANNAFNYPGGMSADGRHIVIVGEASNLTPNDNTRRYRVYTLDRDTDGNGVFDQPGLTTLRRIPGRVAGGADVSGYAYADISNDGRYVAFTQPDVEGAISCLRAYRLDRDVDNNGVFDEPGTTAVVDVTVNSAGVAGSRTGGCQKGIMDFRGSLAISGNGRYVAYNSDFDNLVANDLNNTYDVFVHDMVTGSTIRVPSTDQGGPDSTGSYLGGISDDGRFVVVMGSNGQHLLRYDRDADQDGIFDEPGSVATVVVFSQPTGGSIPSISGDGGTVAFWTSSGVKVWRPSTGPVTVLPVTVNSAGHTKLNASGNVMALETRDAYDPLDMNSLEDVYRVELSGGPPTTVALSVATGSPTTPPAATEIPINNISPQTIRAAGFDVSAAPGGGVKRAPGGGVKRAPGGGVKRAPGGGVKRADELSHFALAFQRVPAIWNMPLASVPIVGGWESRLPVSLAGRPLQSLTFGQVLTAIGPATVQLEQLDLSNTPLVNVSSAALALGNTPLNQLLFDSSTAWCDKLSQVTGGTKTCFGPNSIGGYSVSSTLLELELRADTAQILADHPELHTLPIKLNLNALRNAGAPILQETFATLGLGVSKVGDMPIATAIAATPGIGSLTVADIGNTSLTLDCVVAACPPASALASLQTTGQVQARGRIRDFTSSISTKTLDDVAASLPADLTLNDVLIGLSEAQDFSWETLDLVTSGIQESVAGAATVGYSVQVVATGGTGPFDGTVNVALPAGWRYRAGTAAITPAVSLPLSEPTRTYSHTASTLGFTLTGFMPGVTYTISFTALPGFVLGAAASVATAEVAGISGAASPATITVTEPPDASGDPNTAQVLQSDRLYVSYTTASSDVDLFRFNPPPGKVVSVWLSNFAKDADLTLYGPPTDAAGTAGSPSGQPTRGPAPAAAPLPDEGPTAVGGSLIAEPQGERDVPTLPATATRTVVGSSANSDVDVEGASAVNANLIQVSAYQGTTSSGPYLLRVRVDDTNNANACSYTRSGGTAGPALDINALPSDMETMFLVDQGRLGDTLGNTNAQDLVGNWLTQLTTAPGVKGGLVYLDQAVDFSALNSNWCSPDAANDVVRQIGQVINDVRAARPTLRHIVIVGGDDIIPMARINDITRTGNESQYAQEILDGNGGQSTSLTESLRTKHFLTDDPYGDVDPIAWFNRRLYVPDVAVGRLVESYTEMKSAIQAYLDPNGDGNPVDAGIMPATSTYMTGYDFMADGATQTLGALNTALTQAAGGAPSSSSDISPPSGSVSAAQMLVGAAGAKAVGFFGHFSHDGALSDVGARFGNGDGVTPAQLALALRPASTPPNARLVFSIGCHSGLNVADGLPDSTDFAQSVVGTGAAYVAMSTYGYGAQGAVGLNEQLMTNFAKGLDGGYVRIDPGQADTVGNRRYSTIGEAFVGAKQKYFSSQGLYGPYDEKALEATTFYGLPMYRVGQSGAEQVAPAPVAPAAVGGATYKAFDQSNTFSPTLVSTAAGSYYTVGGLDPQVAANRPVQPRFEADVTATDGSGGVLYAKGVLVTDLDTSSAPTIDPVVTRPILDNSTSESEFGAGDIAYPSVPASITTYTDPLGYTGTDGVRQRQKLVVIPGQFLNNASVDQAGDGTQVLYGKVDTRITYSSSTDWQRPTISSTESTVDAGTAAFAVKAADTAGVQRVLVLFRTADADWAPLDLTLNGSTWEGSVSVGSATTLDYLVQVVDSNGNIATSTGKGRGLVPFVAPVPDPAVVSANNTSAPEGDSGTTPASFTLTLDRPAPASITVGYTITAGTATSGVDYTSTNGAATFAAGDTSATVPLSIVGDTSPESPETVKLALTSVSGAGMLGVSAATMTIIDDDPASVPNTLVNVGDLPNVTEGDSGTHVVNVPISLSPASASVIALTWSVTGGTATIGTDITGATSGVINVPANATSASIPITIVGDTNVEADETVSITVTSITANVSITDSAGLITILNDDSPVVVPSVLTVQAASVVEGTSASSTMVDVPIAISPATSDAVTVAYSLTAGSATAGDDYVVASGTISIPSGATSAAVPVAVVADNVDEPSSETLSVSLGAVTGTASVGGTGSATLTITDDDATPVASVAPVSITEPASASPATFTVALDHPSQSAISVSWATGTGTATAGADYVAASGTVNIPAFATSRTFTVSVLPDTLPESNETVTILLSSPTNATLGSSSSTLTIIDDDAPGLRVNDMATIEGNSGSHVVTLTVTLSSPLARDTTFFWVTKKGTAVAPSDYTSVRKKSVKIRKGATSVTLPVTVRGDTLVEPNETFSVVLTVPIGGVPIGKAVGVVTIIDDDTAPALPRVSVTCGVNVRRAMTPCSL